MTTISGKAIRAVIAANLALRGGFFPLLFTTALWGGLIWFFPGFYAAISIPYLAMFGVWEGLGFRLCCAAPRSWLVPGFREHYRLIRLIALPAVSCAVAAGSGHPETFPALLAILWLCALAGFYVVGLLRYTLAILLTAMFLAAAFLVAAFVAEGLGHPLLPHPVIIHLDARWAVLLLLDVALTIWMWRRIGTQRDLTWIQPGTGAAQERPGSRHLSPPGPARLRNAIRFLSFNPSSPALITSWRGNLWNIFFWSCFSAWVLRHPMTDQDALAFQLLLGMPVLEGCRLSASARMFMLPLQRSETIRRLATGRFLAQLQLWATIALPFSVGLLLQGIALPTVCLLLGATLAEQLPAFGLTLWAGSMMTASGIRYSVIMAPVLFLATACLSLLPHSSILPRTATITLLLSLVLGPILIWLAYRRWLNTEVGAWVSVPAKY